MENCAVLDDIHDIDDYSELTLRAMIDRLERTTTAEQCVYRETELDELWRVVDMALPVAADAPSRAWLTRLKGAVVAAHDLVGMECRPAEAAHVLRAGAAPG
jgi:hypothetical protein